MQKIIFLMLIWSQVAIAQNALPYVQINNATLDTAANTILINYDATDLNSDLLSKEIENSENSLHKEIKTKSNNTNSDVTNDNKSKLNKQIFQIFWSASLCEL